MERSSSSNWVSGLADMFASQGVDAATLFRTASLDICRMRDPRGRFSADEVTRLWEVAIAASGNPGLGVDRTLAARYIDFDVVGYATLSSADLHAALDELARYLALISSATTLELLPRGTDCWLVMGHTGNTRPLPPQRSAYSLLALLTLCRWVTRSEVRPLAVQFSFAAPCDPALFAKAFGCEAEFSQSDNRFLLAASDLAMALPARNPKLLELHEEAMAHRLAALGDATTSLRVSEEIMRRLAGGEPRRQDVADSLGLADRTLQRRLSAENTSFQQLLDDARRDLARKYLAEPRHALGQVAHLLGFADQSNFFRACRRWFGAAPGHLREQLGGRHHPPP